MNGLLLVMLALLALPAAAAHPESMAPQMREDVLDVGHAPTDLTPGQQWTGHIRFTPGHDVDTVHYQICRVGNACFAPPTAAARDGDTFRFDTRDYHTGNGPVRWGIGNGTDWDVGYKFLLAQDGNQSWFPEGIPHGSPPCDALGFMRCDATHYFVFTVPGAVEERDVPAPWWPAMSAVAAVCAIAAWRRT